MKLFKLFTVFILTLLTSSCNNETITDNSLDIIPEKDKQIISSLGFDINNLSDMGTYYVVEGDIMFEKSSLCEYANKDTSKLKQAGHEYLIGRSNVRPITIGVSNSLKVSGKNHWYTEILQAIEEWNNISPECGIFFVFTTNSNPDIMISDDENTLGNGILATGAYPKNKKPGSQIKINLDFWDNCTLSSSQKKYNMVHELGHTIGLVHTNWSSLNEYSGIPISGTPNSGTNPDPNSVMNGGTAFNSWNGFSDYDIIAAKRLQPAFILEITAERSSYPNQILTVDFPLGAVSSDKQYEWSFVRAKSSGRTGNPIKVVPNAPQKNGPRDFEVTVTVSDSFGKKTTKSQTFPSHRLDIRP